MDAGPCFFFLQRIIKCSRDKEYVYRGGSTSAWNRIYFVASVCDQVATNEKAMKELLKESKNNALKDKNYCKNTIVI